MSTSLMVRIRHRMKKDMVYTTLCATWMVLFATLVLVWLDAFLLHHMRHGQTVFCRVVMYFRDSQADVIPAPPAHVSIVQKFSNISIAYSAFVIDEPKFADDLDRKMFLQNVANKQHLLTQDVDKLQGNIQVIQNGTINEIFGCGWNMEMAKMHKRPDKGRIRRHFYILIPLLVPNANSFQHFLDGVLPKLAQVYELLQHPNVTIMLYRPWDRIIEEMLDKLGISDNKVFYYDRGYYTAQYLINTCITPPLHPKLWMRGRSLLGVKTLSDSNMNLVILLTRNLNRNPGRHMTNFEEVERFLSNRYGDNFLVFKGRNDLGRSMDVFSKARIVIGVHGGAFYNIMFSPSGTNVVEVMPTDQAGNVVPENLAHTIVWQMATMMEQSYWRIGESPQTARGDVRIHLTKLQKVLDDIDGKIGRRKRFISDPYDRASL